MKKSILLLCAALFVAGCQQEAGVSDNATPAVVATDAVAADAGDVIAVVNGVDIPAARIALYAGGAEVPVTEREAIINNIITSELIAQAARQAGVAELAQVREELAIAEYTVLGRAYVEDFFANNPVDEARINARYEELSAQVKGEQEYNVAHILLADEASANELHQQIKDNPQAFGELAGKHSEDPGSAANAGSLGWIAPQALVPEFAEAMKTLEAGELSPAPVQTSFGWHIIRVDGRRDIEIPPLNDQLRQRIEQGERADLLSQHIEQLRTDATIERR